MMSASVENDESRPFENAVTPLFRLLFPQGPAGANRFPARVPGQNAAEIRALAGLSFLLFLAVALDLTGGLAGWWWLLRAPLVLALCFLLPHLLFALIALIFKPRGPAPSLRQAWIFLAALTLFAAARVFGGGFGAVASAAWLILTLANAAAFVYLKSLARSRDRSAGA